jgi:hypothetical protein
MHMDTRQVENGADPASPQRSNGAAHPVRTAFGRRDAVRPAAGGRPETFPFAPETVVFHHPPTLGTYDYSYDSYRRAFYHVTSVLQQLHVEQGVELVHAFLDGLLSDADETLRAAKAELVRLIEARTGSKAYPVQAPQAQTREAKVPSYVVRRYLDLLVSIDDYISCVIYAESRGAIKWAQRRRFITAAPRHALDVHDRFMWLARMVTMQEISAADDAVDAVRRIVARVNSGQPDDAATQPEVAPADTAAPGVAVGNAPARASAAPRAPRRGRKSAEPTAERVEEAVDAVAPADPE